jgi:DNA polymerase-3 subunit gamma/tau
LKLAHAQRLLPIEQLLSGAEITRSAAPERPLAPAAAPKKTEVTPPRSFVSPFAADSARKGTPRSELSEDIAVMCPRQNPAAVSTSSVIMGAAAPAVAPQPKIESKIEPKPAPQNCDALRNPVLNALTSAGQTMLTSMLETGEWQLAGNELTIRVASSASLIEMSVSNDARRMMIATASGVLGRPARVQVLPGAAAQTIHSRPASNGSGRGRAEQEPVVQRMKEKFGAEIRTIIDYRRNK